MHTRTERLRELLFKGIAKESFDLLHSVILSYVLSSQLTTDQGDLGVWIENSFVISDNDIID
jgi:hypothetical protein